jgi:lysozyme family protein
VLGDEGGYVNNSADPGGETKYGISRRQYPALDIKSLTQSKAVDIYYHDWWQRFGYSALPEEIGIKLFDLATNIGPGHAARCLQRALRACHRSVVEDGVLGPGTAAAAIAVKQDSLAAALRAEAASYYRVLAAMEGGREAEKEHQFLAGWLNRAYE